MCSSRSDKELLSQDAALRAEVDAMLGARGLGQILGRYGTAHVSGSYALKLMTWRDLDIYVEVRELELAPFFELGGRLAEFFRPLKMTWHRDREGHSELNGHEALYWGVKPDTLGEDWKLDLHAVRPDALRFLVAQNARIAERLTPETRLAILRLKDALWRHDEYRKGFCSQDIYDAVLDDDVRDLDGFKARLRSTRNLAL
jgi:hypothetical protein